MVPTKMKKKLPEHPIFFKGSRIESVIPKSGGLIRRNNKTLTASKASLHKSPSVTISATGKE